MTGSITKETFENGDCPASDTLSSESRAPCIPSSRLKVVIMCFTMAVCHYLMRANLSVAIVCMNSDPPETAGNASHNGFNITTDGYTASVTDVMIPHELKEFQWSRQLRGLLLAIFFVGYMPLQVPAGWLANRFGGKWPLFIGITVLTLSTFLSPIAARVSPYMLLALQVAKGIVAATVCPCLFQLMGRWAPPRERSRVCGFVSSGSTVGILISYGLSGWLCENGFAGGWPSIFYVYAIFTSGMLVLYIFLVYDSPGSHPRISWRERRYIEASLGNMDEVRAVPWRSILRSVPVYAILFANVGSGWVWYMSMTSLAQYIHDVLKFPIAQNGYVSAVAYLLASTVPWPAGWLADHLINTRVLSVVNVRKIFVVIGVMGPATLLLCLSFLDHRHPHLAIACLLTTFALMGCFTLGHASNMLDIAPRYLGVVKGVANIGPNLSGLIAPVITGALTTHGTRQEWQHVYIVTAVVCALGTIQYLIFASGEEQPWDRPTDHSDDKKVVSLKGTCAI